MDKKPKLRVIYTTYPNAKEAETLAYDLVQEKLAACVNILPVTASVYKWKSKIRIENEVVVLVKTSEKKLKKALVYVEKEHPYEVPCILVYRPDSVLKSYEKWLIQQL